MFAKFARIAAVVLVLVALFVFAALTVSPALADGQAPGGSYTDGQAPGGSYDLDGQAPGGSYTLDGQAPGGSYES